MGRYPAQRRRTPIWVGTENHIYGEIPRTETQDANMGRYRESLIWGCTPHRDAGRQYG